MHLTDRCTVLKPTAVDMVLKSPITIANLLRLPEQEKKLILMLNRSYHR